MDEVSFITVKHRIFKLVLFLILGVVVNVAVAWGCALWSPFGLPITRAGWNEDYSVFGYTGHKDKVEKIDGSTCDTSDPCSTYYDRPQLPLVIQFVRKSSAGWPLRCLKCDVNPDPYIPTGSLWRPEQEIKETTNESDFWKYGFPIPKSLQWFDWSIGRELPLRPIWMGFAINTIFYAAMVWILWSTPFAARNIMRRERGLCIKCGYDLRGAEHEACPECGWKCVGETIQY